MSQNNKTIAAVTAVKADAASIAVIVYLLLPSSSTAHSHRSLMPAVVVVWLSTLSRKPPPAFDAPNVSLLLFSPSAPPIQRTHPCPLSNHRSGGQRDALVMMIAKAVIVAAVAATAAIGAIAITTVAVVIRAGGRGGAGGAGAGLVPPPPLYRRPRLPWGGNNAPGLQ